MFSTLLTSSSKKGTHLYTHTHKLIQCTVILFQQKDVWGQGWQNMLLFCSTEDQRTLSTPDNNIVKVYFKTMRHVTHSRPIGKRTCFKRMIINSFPVFFFQQKGVSSQTEDVHILSTPDNNIVKVFLKFCDTWHVTRYRPIRKYACL